MYPIQTLLIQVSVATSLNVVTLNFMVSGHHLNLLRVLLIVKSYRAVYLVLKSSKDLLNGKSVKWFTDCQNVVSIVRKGSSITCLHQLSLVIFHSKICTHSNWSMRIT